MFQLQRCRNGQSNRDGFRYRMHFFFRVLFKFSAYLLAGTLLLCTVAVAAPPYELSGEVRITNISDGDSLRSGNLRIRIFGIDAPELKQQCGEKNGISWKCGLAARRQLESLIGANKTLHCELRDVDHYGRLVMQCFHGNVDIGAEMVRSGYAFAYRSFSKIYEDAESQAKAAHQGIWRGSFTLPWKWRRQN